MKTKILKIAGIALLLIAGFIWAAPYLFKSKLIGLIDARFRKDLRAHVQFSNADISLFRHFPKLTVGLKDLRVVCVGEFQDDTLLSAKQLDLSVNAGSLFFGDTVKVYSINVDEPKVRLLVHPDGHSNWSSLRPGTHPDSNTVPAAKEFNWEIKRYTIHNGYLSFRDEKNNLDMELIRIEQEGKGEPGTELFTLKTKTTADTFRFNQNSTLHVPISSKFNLDLALHIDRKSHTCSFNTDQLAFNEMKFHTEGSVQWINDSSYHVNIRYKVPSTQFKNFLSVLPALYQKDFSSIETNGQFNFNGFIKGKLDAKHFPAYHANLFVTRGYFKYPDLPVAVENINLGIQVDNPDGVKDHATLNISAAHAEMDKDTLDFHLMLKKGATKPYMEFGLNSRIDLSNVSRWMKLDTGIRMSGLVNADVHAKGNIQEGGKSGKNGFQSAGQLEVQNFSYKSSTVSLGMNLEQLLLAFSAKNIQVKEMKGQYFNTYVDASGSLDNFYEYAFDQKPLKGKFDLKADEVNFRDWFDIRRDIPGTTSVHSEKPLIVPADMDLTVTAALGKFHYDNLDLQSIVGQFRMADQAIELKKAEADGLDGKVSVSGMYSTAENRESPEIALTYDADVVDIQKTFFAFYAIRKLMPVAKFMSGSVNAHLSLHGRLRADMNVDPSTLQGDGNVEIITASLRNFGPLDKLAESLSISGLRDLPLNATRAGFTLKNGAVVVSPFLVQSKDMEMEIEGTHGPDLSLDYAVSLRVPRSHLGNKGRVFVKNVVKQAAKQGIPVKLDDAVRMDVVMAGTINNPEVKTDMDAVVKNAENDLKKEVDDFVHSKLDSARDQLDSKHEVAKNKKPVMVQASYKPGAKTKSGKTVSAKNRKKTKHTRTGHSHKKKKSAKGYSV